MMTHPFALSTLDHVRALEDLRRRVGALAKPGGFRRAGRGAGGATAAEVEAAMTDKHITERSALDREIREARIAVREGDFGASARLRVALAARKRFDAANPRLPAGTRGIRTWWASS
jgi:hypothetical protein